VRHFVTNCLVASTAVLFFSDPILGPFFAGVDPDRARMQLYISAVAYGLPLIAAFVAALSMPVRVRVPVLDRLIVAMAILVVVTAARGFIAGNELRFIASDTFNFAVPVLVYGAMRVVDDVEAILRGLRWILVASVVPQAVYCAWVVAARRTASAGMPFFVLYPTWFLHEGSAIGVIASLIAVIVTRKRMLILCAVGAILLFAILTRRRRHVLAAIALTAVMIAGALALPGVRARFAYLSHETGGFTNLQVRQDELRDIGRNLRERDWPLSLIIGQGMGATYRLTVGETAAQAKPFIIPHHHDTHVSPAGWLLRTGIIGMLIYGAFFLIGGVMALRATQTPRDAALTAGYWMMLAMSLTTFTVPMLPIVTLTMLLVVAPRAVRQ